MRKLRNRLTSVTPKYVRLPQKSAGTQIPDNILKADYKVSVDIVLLSQTSKV